MYGEAQDSSKDSLVKRCGSSLTQKNGFVVKYKLFILLRSL